METRRLTRVSGGLAAALLILISACSRERVPVETPVEQTPETVAGVSAIVRLDEELAAKAESGTLEGYGICGVERLFPDAGRFEARTRREGLHRWYVVEFDTPITKAAGEFGGLPGVEVFQAPVPVAPSTNDRFFGVQWDMFNPDAPGTDINVVPVWERYTTGDPSVVVSVVDGGIQLDHEDLAWNCSPSDHYNFVSDTDIVTAHDHGVHVAGTIAAVSNNYRGIAGIAGGDYLAGRRGVTLLSSQIFEGSGREEKSANDAGVARALKWGADHGAVISQNSWGHLYDLDGNGSISEGELSRAAGDNITPSEKAAIDYFIKYAGCDENGDQLPGSPMKGGLVVFAAGNDNIPYGYPAAYPPVVAVGATASDGSMSDFSNYGDWVDILAPGSNISSTVSGNGYSAFNGTSMACPHVSGVAALLLSWYGGPGYTPEMLRERLLGGAADTPAGPFLDALGAFEYGASSAPVGPSDITASSSGNTITVSFAAKADASGNLPYAYLALASPDADALRHADPSHPGEGFKYASLQLDAGVSEGDVLNLPLRRLDYGTHYYVAVAAYDIHGSFSAISNFAEGDTPANNNPVITTDYAGDYRFRESDEVEISYFVSDPDGHAFSVEAAVDGRATLRQVSSSEWKFSLLCALQGDHDAHAVSIAATDEYGGKTVLEFSYRVVENNAPEVASVPEGFVLEGKDSEAALILDGSFSDPDGDALGYEISGGNASVVSARIDGGTLTLKAVGYGLSTLTLAAKDFLGGRAEVEIPVRVREKGKAADVYPNPVTDVLHVATGIAGSEASVRISSASGAVVLETRQTCSAFEPMSIDVHALAPGRYNVRVSYGDETFNQTIVKR